NSIPGANTVEFSPLFNTPQTITLTGGQLELSNGSGLQAIEGPSAGVTVSGGGTSRVFQVDPGVTATISGLTITDGRANVGGGICDNGANLTLVNDVLDDDIAQGMAGVAGGPGLSGTNGGDGLGG